MEATIKQPLTNVQLELLKTFSYNLSVNEIAELKKNLARFFAKRLIKQADSIWESQSFTDKKVDELLNTKLRKSKQL